TIMGMGRRLHEYRGTIQVIAVEPDDALHGLEGLKHMASSLVPGIWRPREAVDRILPISTEEGWDTSERVAHEEALFCGHSSGAAVAGALKIARESVERGEKAVIVILLPDAQTRYLDWRGELPGPARAARGSR